ncbi:MAG: MFS transporter [Chloroflexi bacterium]|nr:MFS transporter [Chloroflexota bacterium]
MFKTLSLTRKRVFYGWWVVLANVILIFFADGAYFYSLTAYFNPISQEFGWSSTTTSLAFSIRNFVKGAAAPVVGVLHDRHGSRRVMATGIIILGAGSILLSLTNSILLFYLSFIVIAIGFVTGTFVVAYASVANWFARKRGRAMAILSLGTGLSGLLVPVIVWLISAAGWRKTLIIAGLGIWVIGLPLSRFVRSRPEEMGLLPDGDSRPLVKVSATSASGMSEGISAGDAMRTNSFKLMCLANMAWNLTGSAILVHVMPYLTISGFSRTAAGLVTMLIPVVGLGGSLVIGSLSDFVEKRFLWAIGLGLMCAGVLSFTFSHEIWQVILSVIIFGFGYGGVIPTRNAMQGEYFGRRAFGVIMGLIIAIGTIGQVIGPILAGWVFDSTHSYRWAFIIVGITAASGIVPILWAKKPRKAASPA